MKKINVLGKKWSVELLDLEFEMLVIARRGDKFFVEFIDFCFCRLEPSNHAIGCENLTDEEYEAIRDRINEDLEEIAIESGYTIRTVDGRYDGTFEYVGDDIDLAEKIRGMY